MTIHRQKIHPKMEHNDAGEQITYNCPICNRTFNANRDWRTHRRRFHPTEREQELSKKVYKSVIDENGKRKLECEICLKLFHQRSGIEQHTLTVHEGLRDHQCAECGRHIFSTTYIHLTISGLVLDEKL